MSERILVTGGAGYIGSNIAAALLKRPATDVVVVDDFSSGDWRNLIHVDCEVRAADCDDPLLLEEIADGAFSAIFHQAAITDTTVMDQRLMVEVNTNAFAGILAASSLSGTRVTYASSAGTYGNSPAPNRIGHGEEPENIYGFSKLAMDRVACRWYDRHPAPIIGLRYFNVFGPGETHKNERDGNKTASMILQLYEQVKAGKQVRLFKYGEQKRDFVYIRDVVSANLAALDAPRSGVCNVGSGEARSFNDIVSNLSDLLGRQIDVEYFDNPFTFYQEHTEADLSDSKMLLNWKPAWTLEKGMQDYISLLENGHRGPAEIA
ncbi:ADP-L-glycero-D-manno-heptose 6-epimerase [Mariprofundus ferrinatatus]|uniref:ADP-L-glycero-D-manno-heptose 6-epimerase n=1 Tax=Mariprofundus ferrinatatus TaxID=1921087 RepID=A0A2K8L7J1_9PROT|nr:ADP-glyceromanno-heptose 6-epimerase [Mariprofundus ferrinatatus]ATX81831.1 ADP-L-glycero-D-manno-heptose 6-epimerase [Mariprofundus ferrinatatus]